MRQLIFTLTLFLVLGGLAGCKPTPRYTADTTGGRAPLTVAFKDNSATLVFGVVSLDALFPVTRHEWDFGDGGGSLEPDISHTFDTTGNFTVTYSVSNLFGTATRRDEGLIRVQGQTVDPVAKFTFTVPNVSNRLAIQFTDGSVGGSSPITAWAWDFGDDATSTEESPKHTYAEAGVYMVTLDVTTASGADTVTMSVALAQDPPKASFTFVPSFNTPLSFDFTDTSDPGTGTITARRWNFGDGATSTERNPSHLYATAGRYNVILEVETASGANTTDAVSVPALETANPSFTFVADTTNTLSIQFTDTSTPGALPIAGWTWEFGDDETSTQQNPLHTYAAAGTYIVRLRVENAATNRRTNRDVTVVAP